MKGMAFTIPAINLNNQYKACLPALTHLTRNFRREDFNARAFTANFNPYRRLKFVTCRVPTTCKLNTFNLLMTSNAIYIRCFVVPLYRIQALRVRPLICTRMVTEAVTMIYCLTFRREFIARLSKGFRRLMRIIMRARSAILSSIVNRYLRLYVISFRRVSTNNRYLNNRNYRNSLIFRLIKARTKRFISNMIRVFRRVVVCNLCNEATGVNLRIIAMSSNKARVNRRAVMDPYASNACFTTVKFMNFMVFTSYDGVFNVAIRTLRNNVNSTSSIMRIRPCLIRYPR